MTVWFKVCNSLAQHRKAMEAGPEALGLWVLAGAWSCAQCTDGFIPDYMLTRLEPNAEALASRLLQVGLWTRAEGGYQFHDWHDYQPDGEAERLKRERRREAGRKGGVRSGEARRNRPQRTKREANASAHASPHAQANAEAHAEAQPEAKSNPVPDPDSVPTGTPPYSPPTAEAGDPQQPAMLATTERATPRKHNPADDRFGEFWEIYPKRVGKQAALKAWRKALALADAGTILAGARRYATARAGHDPQYTAHPSTWLNHGRWDDEDQPTPQGPQGPAVSTADERIAALQARKRSSPGPSGTVPAPLEGQSV